MTIENIKQLELSVFQNPNMFQLIVKEKSSMQKILIEGLSNTELLDVQKSTINQSIVDKMIKIAANHVAVIGASKENSYCIAMAAGTILKELFEDQSFVTSSGIMKIMDEIISKADKSNSDNTKFPNSVLRENFDDNIKFSVCLLVCYLLDYYENNEEEEELCVIDEYIVNHVLQGINGSIFIWQFALTELSLHRVVLCYKNLSSLNEEEFDYIKSIFLWVAENSDSKEYRLKQANNIIVNIKNNSL